MGGLVLESHARRRRQRRNSPQMSNRVQRKGSAHAPTAVQKPKRKFFSKRSKGKKKQKEAEQDDDRNEIQDGGRSLYSERDQGTASIESVVEPTEYGDCDSTFAFGFSLSGVYQLGQTYNDVVVSTLFPVQGDQSVEVTAVEESVENGAEEKAVEKEAKEGEFFAEVVDVVVKQERKQEDSIAGVEEIEVVVKQEAKKEECFAEVQEEVVKRDVKKKRGLFGRKKHQQNKAKSHADEKREIDSVKSPVISDARDEADEAAATVADQKANDNITSKEEEIENNVDESNCCKDKNTKEMGAKTNAQESYSRLENRFANKIEAIFQLESNSLIDSSLKGDATFQAKPVPSPEQDCNAIEKNTDVDELQIAKNNSDMEGQEILGKVVRDDNTVVSFLTQATGQTMWTRYFGPALFASQKKESEVGKEDDDNVEKSDSFIGSVGGDTDTVVSGLTRKDFEQKSVPSTSRSIQSFCRSRLVKSKSYKTKHASSSRPDQSKSSKARSTSRASIAQASDVPASATSVKSSVSSSKSSKAKAPSSDATATSGPNQSFSQDASAIEITRTRIAPLRPMTAYVSPTMIRRKNRAKEMTVSQQKTDEPSSASSVKSSSKSSKAKAPSSDETTASIPTVPSSSRSVKSSGGASKSSKTRPSSRASTSAPTVPSSSSSSVKSAGGLSKSSKAKTPSSDETTASIPTVPSSSRSVKSSGGASKSSKTRPSSRASIALASIASSSSRSVKSSGGTSKSSKAKAPSSDETTASIPTVPSSSRSVKSSGGASKSSKTRPPSRESIALASIASSTSRSVKSAGGLSKSSKAKAPSSDETTASIPTVPSSSRSVKSSGGASKSSKTRPPSRASIALASVASSSSRSVKSSGGTSKSSKAKAPSSDETTASIPTVPSSSRSVESSGGTSKSSKTRPPSRATSIASAPTVVASAPNQSSSQHVAGIEITRTRTAPLQVQ